MTTTDVTASRYEELTLTALAPHPKNPRRNLGSVSELAESITAQGVLQPLVVAPGKSAGKYVLIAGHRRHAAAKKAGLKRVPCMIRDDLDTDVLQLQAMLTENLQRAELNAIEEGDGYQALLDYDLKVKDIASTTGTAQKRIRERVKLASSPQDLREKLILHQVSIDEAMELQTVADDDDRYAELSRYLGTPNWKWAVENARRSKARAAEQKKIRAELTAEGVQVLTMAERGQASARRSKELGYTVVWARLGGRPETVVSPDVCASLPDYGPVDKPEWWRLETADVDDTEDDNGVADGGGDEATDDEAAAAAAEARRLAGDAAVKLVEDLAVAADVRRAHLKQVILTGDTGIARRCQIEQLAWMLREQLDTDAIEFVCDVLKVTIPNGATDGDERVIQDVRQQAECLDVDQLAILLRVAENLWNDQSLRAPATWAREFSGDVEWRAELVDVYGYQFSDVETSLLPAPDDDADDAQAAGDA